MIPTRTFISVRHNSSRHIFRQQMSPGINILKLADVGIARLRFSLFACLVCVFLLHAGESPRLDLPSHPIRIDSVRAEKTTTLSHDTIYFHAHCFWNGAPGECWYYRDSVQNAVVTEFFNSGIRDYETAFPPDRRSRNCTEAHCPASWRLRGRKGAS